jgi:hypothetical protein
MTNKGKNREKLKKCKGKILKSSFASPETLNKNNLKIIITDFWHFGINTLTHCPSKENCPMLRRVP